MGNRPCGALGSDTNCRDIDPQTSQRTTNLPPGLAGGGAGADGLAGTATTSTTSGAPAVPLTMSGVFNVALLPPVLRNMKFGKGAALMDAWIAGDPAEASVDPKRKNKATVGVNADRLDIDTFDIGWDWLDQYQRAKDAVTKLRQIALSDNAVVQIKKTHSAPGRFNEWLRNDVQPSVYRQYITTAQIQYVQCEGGTILDDLNAALHDFGFFTFCRGETIPNSQFAARAATIAPFLPTLKPDGFFTSTAEEKMKWLDENLSAIIIVTSFAVYAGDIYEFGGPQYLGDFDLTNKTVTLSSWSYAWTSDTAQMPNAKNVISANNATFRAFRSKTKHGGDLLVLSPLREFTDGCPRAVGVEKP